LQMPNLALIETKLKQCSDYWKPHSDSFGNLQTRIFLN
jgi:hypothetical protein